jgi:carbonic anhydrase/acetyltransferase-like protein (isoleucine patch superfamily)
MALYSIDGVEPQLPENGDYWIADSAEVMGRVKLEPGASVWFGVVIRGDNDLITIGQNSNVQDNAVIHTDPGVEVKVGKGVTIGHQATLHGCTIGDNSLVGIGATILNGAVIGKNCLIGAHAFIPEGREIPDNSMVLGAPGKVVKELGADMVKMLQGSAASYVANHKRFKAGLKKID